jgi:hypothetical protein
MTLPNFIVVGAPKAGTTSLYDYLRKHPEIFMPKIKAPRFFIYNGQTNSYYYPATTLEEYEALFADAAGEKAIGEATALYFEHPDTARRIHEVVPRTRIIAILREPVQRAFSIYHMNLRDSGHNKGLSFIEALKVDDSIKKMYYDGLKPYYDLFDRDQIKILFLEDLERDPKGTLADLFTFLGVDPGFVPDLKVSNPGGVPKVRLLHDLLINRRIRLFSRRYLPESLVSFAKDFRSKNLKKHVMTEEERRVAYGYFEKDILATQELTGFDLSRWLQEPRETAPVAAPAPKVAAGAKA